MLSGLDVTWFRIGTVAERLGRRHVNQEMVQEGMAWHYVQYSNSKELEQARQAERGLWAIKDPIPPWGGRKAAK